jgi:Sjoegren syndrome nuclear autoantigen 1
MYHKEFSNPLGLEELKERKEQLTRQIEKEEDEKQRTEKEIAILTEKLNRLNDSLAKKHNARDEFDKTIRESESAFSKVENSILIDF